MNNIYIQSYNKWSNWLDVEIQTFGLIMLRFNVKDYRFFLFGHPVDKMYNTTIASFISGLNSHFIT